MTLSLDDAFFMIFFVSLDTRFVFKVLLERHSSSYGCKAAVCVFVFAVELRWADHLETGN